MKNEEKKLEDVMIKGDKKRGFTLYLSRGNKYYLVFFLEKFDQTK